MLRYYNTEYEEYFPYLELAEEMVERYNYLLSTCLMRCSVYWRLERVSTLVAFEVALAIWLTLLRCGRIGTEELGPSSTPLTYRVKTW